MPQGRRKTPFSGKAKKEQLKAKKQAKSGILSTQGIKNFTVSCNTHENFGDFFKKANQRSLY